LDTVFANHRPQRRPLQGLSRAEIGKRFDLAALKADGAAGGTVFTNSGCAANAINIERALERLWAEAAATIPDWLPSAISSGCRPLTTWHLSLRAAAGAVDILPGVAGLRGQPRGPYGRVRGNEHKDTPAQRFDQHKTGSGRRVAC